MRGSLLDGTSPYSLVTTLIGTRSYRYTPRALSLSRSCSAAQALFLRSLIQSEAANSKPETTKVR